MILAIDIGNTTIALSALQGERVCFTARLSTQRTQGLEDCLPNMQGALRAAGAGPKAFRGAVITSVVPRLTPVLQECARRITGRRPLMVGCAIRTGFQICVPNPEKIGHDRLVDMAYAAAHLPLPAVTVDMGTATTFSVLDKNANFIGGVIAPGLGTGLYALSNRAAQLPSVRVEPPGRIIGRTTVEAMTSGAVAGAAAMIDGMLARIEEELGGTASVIITGGLARHVAPLCRHPMQYDPELLMKGLALLWEYNRAKESEQ